MSTPREENRRKGYKYCRKVLDNGFSTVYTEQCKNCGGVTKSMFKLNHGLFCDKCYEAQKVIQDGKLLLERLSDAIKSLNE